jgi:hypothetical protein
MVDGTRSALIVASAQYTDPGLRRLRAPASDAEALAAVLRDPQIGGFEVRTLLNEPAYEVNLAVEEFFADRRPDDLLLVHFSCHGVKDQDGELYFAAANTVLRALGATAVAAEFVNRRMSRSRSRRVVLLLDCCYAGAFERGMTARAGAGVGIEAQFGGRGRAVITASSAMEYAFEGGELADAQELQPSVFTSALVAGLATGEADRDQDGMVALDELYDYVYDKVRAATPNQTPSKWTFGVQGDLYIARRARPVTTPAPLPPQLQEAIDSPFAAVRAAAVQELARLLNGRHAGLALAAQQTLQRLTGDDSRTVAAAATAALGTQALPMQAESTPPRLTLSDTVVDFGQLPQHGQSPERRVHLSNAGGGSLNARAATSASWLQLRQVADDVVFGVDTTAAGEHEATVTLDTNGGSATIHVHARVDPNPPPDSAARLGGRPPAPRALAAPPPDATAEPPALTGSPVGPTHYLPTTAAGLRRLIPRARHWAHGRINRILVFAVSVTVISITTMLVVVLANRTPGLTDQGKRNANQFASDQLRSFATKWLNDLTSCATSASDTHGGVATEKLSCSTGGKWSVNFRAYASIAERNKARDDRRNNYRKDTEEDLAGKGPNSGVQIRYTEESIYQVVYWDDDGSPVSGDLFTSDSSFGFDGLMAIWRQHVQ